MVFDIHTMLFPVGPLFRYFPLCLLSSGSPTVPVLSCINLSEDISGAVKVTVSWTLSGRDRTDFYLINITTNALKTPYGGLLNITNTSVTPYELTGFVADYEYNITVHGVNCGSQKGGESEPLTITSQGMCMQLECCISYPFAEKALKRKKDMKGFFTVNSELVSKLLSIKLQYKLLLGLDCSTKRQICCFVHNNK